MMNHLLGMNRMKIELIDRQARILLALLEAEQSCIDDVLHEYARVCFEVANKIRKEYGWKELIWK